MKSAYFNLIRTIDSLPKLKEIGNVRLTKTVNKPFANEMKEYCISGESRLVPNCEKIQLQLVEEYFGKCKDGKYFEELPFFKKITETRPSYGDRALVITRTNGKGLSTETTINAEGIRLDRVEKRLSKDGNNYEYTRYVYNENGTKPSFVSSWIRPVG